MSMVLAVVVLTFIACVRCQNLINPDILSSKVEELTENSLKYKELQEHFDSLRYINQPLQGETLLNSLTKSLERKFQERIDVVKKLKKVASTAYSGTTSSTTECCKFSSSLTEFDPRFKQKVAANRVCEQISSTASPSPTRLSSTFRDTCIENLQNLPSLKWQYFGSEQGVTTSFPALPSTNCENYDNRFRPWYVQTNVPEPKEVVIVIDKSASMTSTHNGVSLMTLAKQAAISVIDTLNPHDKFAVVAFSNNAVTLGLSLQGADRCFSKTLAQANPQNKAKVKELVNTLSPGGGTNYGSALTTAFKFLQDAFNMDIDAVSSVDRVILFMSDGKPNDLSTNILATLRDRNRQLNNTAVMMTYGVGKLTTDFSVLESMAQQSGGTSGGPDVTRGLFTSITNPNNLRNQMSSYYKFYAAASQGLTEPIWTVPYLDSWGLGQMITASLPVYVNNNLVGVAAVDVTIEELFAESTYFKPNELSYSFIIKENGLVINHPLFPYVDDHDSLFVSATAFERDTEFLSIFESMKRGDSGSKTITTTRVIAQGDSRRYGAKELRNIRSTYYWKRIPNTKFSVCLVLAVNDTQSVLSSQGSLRPGSFLYHRLDLLPPKTPCYHLNSYCSMDQSSVMLASRAFSDPEYYLSRTFTRTDVQSIGNYMEGIGGNSQRIKDDVVDEVVATYKADVLWTNKNENTELQEQVVWRYVGTKNGLFRNFPGTQMPDDFDPILRPWYEHALANRESNVITPPYNDAASGAVIITLSHVLYEGRSTGMHDPVTDEIVAVMGVDILLSYFHTILHELYPVCETTYKCMIIDYGGFVVLTNEYLESSANSVDKHLTEVQPDISNVLIKEGILQSISCSNIESALLQRTYKIALNHTSYSGSTGGHRDCYTFELIPIKNTNVLMLLRSKEKGEHGCRFNLPITCTKYNNNKCSSLWNSQDCESPCESPNPNYHPCENSYTFSSNSTPPCTPENAVLSSVTLKNVDLSKLPICYNVSFVYVPSSDSDSSESGSNVGAIVGGVVGGLSALIVIAIIIIYKSKICKKKTPDKRTSVREAPNVNATAPPPPPTNPAYTNPVFISDASHRPVHTSTSSSYQHAASQETAPYSTQSTNLSSVDRNDSVYADHPPPEHYYLN